MTHPQVNTCNKKVRPPPEGFPNRGKYPLIADMVEDHKASTPPCTYFCKASLGGIRQNSCCYKRGQVHVCHTAEDPPEGQSVQVSSGTLILCRLGQWMKHFKKERGKYSRKAKDRENNFGAAAQY